MLAYQSYIFLVVITAASLGLSILVRAILLSQKSATAARRRPSFGVPTADSEPGAAIDPALLLSKSGKPLAGAALQNRLEALARRQGNPLESE